MTPRATSPPGFTADQRKDGILGLTPDAAHDLLDRGVALDHCDQTVVEDRAHTLFDCNALDRGIVGALEDQTIDRPVRYQELGDGPSAAITGAAAGGAASRMKKGDCLDRSEAFEAEPFDQRRRRRIGRLAHWTQPADEPLRQDRLQRRCHQVIFEPHVAQPRHCRRCGIRMDGRQHEMTGQRRLHGNLHGFEIADLADHYDVGVLPQDRAQQAGEIEPDLRLYLDLIDARQLILDRVFDGYDVARHRVQLQEAGVERRRLAAAGWPGHQYHTVRQIERAFDPLPNVGGQAELCEVELDGGAVEDAQDDLLAVQRRDRRNPKVD